VPHATFMSIRPSRMKLRCLSQDFALQNEADDMINDKANIDYTSVGLYIGGIQVVAAVVICSLTSILSCWILPPHAVSAVRTLAVSVATGLVVVRKPVRVGTARGATLLFSALRPVVPLYLLALVLEQLCHTCVAIDSGEDADSVVRRVLYHALTVMMLLSGISRARFPRSESDLPFYIVASATLVIAAFPPVGVLSSGPLCVSSTVGEAAERVTRAFFFASLYTCHVYAAAPTRAAADELFVCVARATAASIWTLCASLWLLPMAPLQISVLLFSRLGSGEYSQAADDGDDDDESVGHGGGDQLPLGGHLSDVESASTEGDFGNKLTPHYAYKNGRTGLSFAFNGGGNGNDHHHQAPHRTSFNVAAVLAREDAMQ